MFSGKTEVDPQIGARADCQIARGIFKPQIDTRYAKDEIVSHSRLTIPSRLITSPWEIMEYADEADVIGIDEAQFLGKDLIDVVQKLANSGKRAICAGLDTDYRGEPFDPIPQLLAIAEYIDKPLAICMRCGNPAKHTQRVVASRERVLVGATEAYEPRCRNCLFLPIPRRKIPRRSNSLSPPSKDKPWNDFNP